MWRPELVQTLFLDMMPLKRRGMDFTWKSLEHLHRRLVASTVYECGDAEGACAGQAEGAPRPSLFDKEKKIIPLPQANMLIEFSSGGQRKAALLTDTGESGVQAFIFRYNEERQRWIWPLTGMHYGPSFDNNNQIAVYEPQLLEKVSPAARGSMVKAHVLDTGTAVALLEKIRSGELAPSTAPGKSAAEIMSGKKERISAPTPSSFARAARTRHGTAPTGKGARRS